MSPVSPVFHTEITVIISLKKQTVFTFDHQSYYCGTRLGRNRYQIEVLALILATKGEQT